MVCAAVSAMITPDRIEKIYHVRLESCLADILDLNIVVNLINAAAQSLPGIIIAEKGDMYNQEAWRVESILGRDFKYPESLGELAAIELAHHISLAGRRLIMEIKEEQGNEGR